MNSPFKGLTIRGYIAGGILGDVYLVTDRSGKQYAMKVVKSNKILLAKDPLWREMLFFKFIHSFPPSVTTKFIRIEDDGHLPFIKYVETCKPKRFTQEQLNYISSRPKWRQQEYHRRQNLPGCIYYVTTFVEGDTLLSLIKTHIETMENNLNVDNFPGGQLAIYKILLQIFEAMKWLKKYGYSHGDVNFANIMVSYPSEYNPKVTLIDYGSASHINWCRTERDFEVIKHKDFAWLFGSLCVTNYFDEFERLSDEYGGQYPVSKDVFTADAFISQQPQFRQLLNLSAHLPPFVQHSLCSKFFYVQSHELLKRHLTSICPINNELHFKQCYMLPVDDMLFLLQNSTNYDKIISHLRECIASYKK